MRRSAFLLWKLGCEAEKLRGVLSGRAVCAHAAREFSGKAFAALRSSDSNVPFRGASEGRLGNSIFEVSFDAQENAASLDASEAASVASSQPSPSGSAREGGSSLAAQIKVLRKAAAERLPLWRFQDGVSRSLAALQTGAVSASEAARLSQVFSRSVDFVGRSDWRVLAEALVPLAQQMTPSELARVANAFARSGHRNVKLITALVEALSPIDARSLREEEQRRLDARASSLQSRRRTLLPLEDSVSLPSSQPQGNEQSPNSASSLQSGSEKALASLTDSECVLLLHFCYKLQVRAPILLKRLLRRVEIGLPKLSFLQMAVALHSLAAQRRDRRVKALFLQSMNSLLLSPPTESSQRQSDEEREIDSSFCGKVASGETLDAGGLVMLMLCHMRLQAQCPLLPSALLTRFLAYVEEENEEKARSSPPRGSGSRGRKGGKEKEKERGRCATTPSAKELAVALVYASRFSVFLKDSEMRSLLSATEKRLGFFGDKALYVAAEAMSRLFPSLDDSPEKRLLLKKLIRDTASRVVARPPSPVAEGPKLLSVLRKLIAAASSLEAEGEIERVLWESAVQLLKSRLLKRLPCLSNAALASAVCDLHFFKRLQGVVAEELWSETASRLSSLSSEEASLLLLSFCLPHASLKEGDANQEAKPALDASEDDPSEAESASFAAPLEELRLLAVRLFEEKGNLQEASLRRRRFQRRLLLTAAAKATAALFPWNQKMTLGFSRLIASSRESPASFEEAGSALLLTACADGAELDVSERAQLKAFALKAVADALRLLVLNESRSVSGRLPPAPAEDCFPETTDFYLRAPPPFASLWSSALLLLLAREVLASLVLETNSSKAWSAEACWREANLMIRLLRQSFTSALPQDSSTLLASAFLGSETRSSGSEGLENCALKSDEAEVLAALEGVLASPKKFSSVEGIRERCRAAKAQTGGEESESQPASRWLIRSNLKIEGMRVPLTVEFSESNKEPIARICV